MSLKNWPSWVKGGIIFIIIALLILPFETIPEIKKSTDFFGKYITTPLGGLFFLPGLFLMWGLLGDSPSNTSHIIEWLVVIIFTILWVFIIGAILGWIYEKIKGKTKNTENL